MAQKRSIMSEGLSYKAWKREISEGFKNHAGHPVKQSLFVALTVIVVTIVVITLTATLSIFAVDIFGKNQN